MRRSVRGGGARLHAGTVMGIVRAATRVPAYVALVSGFLLAGCLHVDRPEPRRDVARPAPCPRGQFPVCLGQCSVRREVGEPCDVNECDLRLGACADSTVGNNPQLISCVADAPGSSSGRCAVAAPTCDADLAIGEPGNRCGRAQFCRRAGSRFDVDSGRACVAAASSAEGVCRRFAFDGEACDSDSSTARGLTGGPLPIGRRAPCQPCFPGLECLDRVCRRPCGTDGVSVCPRDGLENVYAFQCQQYPSTATGAPAPYCTIAAPHLAACPVQTNSAPRNAQRRSSTSRPIDFLPGVLSALLTVGTAPPAEVSASGGVCVDLADTCLNGRCCRQPGGPCAEEADCCWLPPIRGTQCRATGGRCCLLAQAACTVNADCCDLTLDRGPILGSFPGVCCGDPANANNPIAAALCLPGQPAGRCAPTPCGRLTQVCCAAGVCFAPLVCHSTGRCVECVRDRDCGFGRFCRNNTCQNCGEEDEVCCPGERCNDRELSCQGGTCRPRCGRLGLTCCDPPNAPFDPRCRQGACDRDRPGATNTCVPCGRTGQPCCDVGQTACQNGLSCQSADDPPGGFGNPPGPTMCLPCGNVLGARCCGDRSCAVGVCDPARFRCAPCGGVQQLCCRGNTCNAGAVCNAGTQRCAPCGGFGERCCESSDPDQQCRRRDNERVPCLVGLCGVPD